MSTPTPTAADAAPRPRVRTVPGAAVEYLDGLFEERRAAAGEEAAIDDVAEFLSDKIAVIESLYGCLLARDGYVTWACIVGRALARSLARHRARLRAIVEGPVECGGRAVRAPVALSVIEAAREELERIRRSEPEGGPFG